VLPGYTRRICSKMVNFSIFSPQPRRKNGTEEDFSLSPLPPSFLNMQLMGFIELSPAHSILFGQQTIRLNRGLYLGCACHGWYAPPPPRVSSGCVQPKVRIRSERVPWTPAPVPRTCSGGPKTTPARSRSKAATQDAPTWANASTTLCRSVILSGSGWDPQGGYHKTIVPLVGGSRYNGLQIIFSDALEPREINHQIESFARQPPEEESPCRRVVGRGSGAHLQPGGPAAHGRPRFGAGGDASRRVTPG
jgi:hypothetical protein